MNREFPLAYRERLPLEFYPDPFEHFDAEILEIGPGRGDFLLESAEANPTVRFAAVEIGKKRFKKLGLRMDKRGIRNVQLVRGDARVVLPRHCRNESLRQIYVLFPDPWPKNRHVHNRLLKVDMLRFLAGLLRSEGELFVATDVRNYIDWVIRNSEQIASLRHINPDYPELCPISVYQPTYFEQKWRSEGRRIWYVAFRKLV